MQLLLKNLRKITSVLLLGIFVFFFAAAPAQAQTSEWTGKCVGPSDLRGSIDASDVATITGLECLIANVFTVILTIIGLAGFVMTLFGSFQWMLSGGNTKGTELAKNTMTYAVIGLVVALSAFIFISLISTFTGISIITQFRIPNSDWTYE